MNTQKIPQKFTQKVTEKCTLQCKNLCNLQKQWRFQCIIFSAFVKFLDLINIHS